MYALLWRSLPGPPALRVLVLLALATLVVAALFAWVFPVVSEWLPFTDVTLDAP